jgi:hypothetical protein
VILPLALAIFILMLHDNEFSADFITGNFKPGSGGEADFYKLLTGQKSIQDFKD